VLIKNIIPYFLFLLFFTSLAFSSPTHQHSEIKLIALFKDKAMVKINSKQLLLQKNKKNRHGVVLISADSEKAIIRTAGVDKTYQLSMLIATSYNQRKQAEVTYFYLPTVNILQEE